MGFSVVADLLAWLAFVSATVALPGVGLQRALRQPIEPAFVLPLGTAFCAAAYWSSLVTTPLLFPVLVLAGGLACVLPFGAWRWADGPSFRGALFPLLAFMALLALTQYPWNRLGPDGTFLLDSLVPFDTAFHVGLTRELVVGYPPELPGVSGFPLGYHLGSDLVRAAALRWAGVDPFDSISRFDVTLYGFALMLVLRATAARMGASPMVVTLAPWTLLATDFSFVFAALPGAHWWADLLRGNVLLSLVMANPIVPALSLALGALIALSRYETEGDRRLLGLAAAFAGAVPFFKVFLGAHLLLGVGVVVLLRGRPLSRSTPMLWFAVPCALATAALVLGQGGQTVDVVLAPFDLARVTRSSLDLPPLSGLAFLAWAALWTVASLGLRVLGLGPAMAALRGGATLPAILGAMALAGWPLGLLFRISAPEVLPGQKFVNDAGYLLEQSGPLLWIFALTGVAALAARTRFARVTAVIAVGLAVPATLQFVAKKSTEPPDPLPAAAVRAMRALEGRSQPGDVVLQRPAARFPPAPVILIGRRVPYERYTPYLTQFATRASLEERHRVVHRFFQTSDRDEALAIARSLGARFLAL
ncbi:MAG TPA: hypothetical protein VI669_04165, partial [Vicinamibacteria bacterium]